MADTQPVYQARYLSTDESVQCLLCDLRQVTQWSLDTSRILVKCKECLWDGVLVNTSTEHITVVKTQHMEHI